MGSSAGGHLAACVSNLHEQGLKADDEGDAGSVSSRPDFAVLCYAVITADPAFSHAGSFRALLGEENCTGENLKSLSQETCVTRQTPPTFLWHTLQDKSVPCENSILYARALRNASVPFELHIYEKGRHGQGLFTGHPWAEECVRWLSGF